MGDLQSRLARYRLRADREFEDRIRNSALDRQQWDLAMTAVTFRFTDAADPDAAELVADTTGLDDVLPEMRAVEGDRRSDDRDGGGLLPDVAGALGLSGSDGGDELAREAERLAAEYAEELAAVLRAENAWDDLRRVAADGG